ncbi:hypothetical protein CONCODRAFT_80007 [Conidiobolus coronatus NRRL 28638]|uniref:Uncharacterized protein n=1 Tax=Conidiobolus coronatus (strain ATCC 28846 / CBS 209.66 / NRRL 28638) TaxID=796925 RepID=A0A137NYL1_CONC2|nr:hypothetical protein CONCODRAFT_80007 [Conidiobolus coronatus NRRL 28638]|eukprot:KXN67758.1 hypothetical protein CONCODRAFT_80007 [Conidiobolus coronatus NRRL 28638]
MLPCILTTSSGLFLIILAGISIIILIYWFFLTYGTKDLRAVTAGAKSNVSLLSRSFSSNKPPTSPNSSAESRVQSPHLRSPNLNEARSSENLNQPKTSPPEKALLRLLIFLLTLASALLLIGHLSFTFMSSYAQCHASFIQAFPNLSDSQTGNNSTSVNSWEEFRSDYVESSVNNVAYPSAMMLDISRATLITALVLLACDYPGAVYRHLSASVSKNYFKNWWDWFTRLGYLYAIVSFFVTIVVRTLLSPSSPNLALVAVNLLMDTELLILSIIFSAYFIIFLIKRKVKSPRVHVSVTSPAEVNERAKNSMARLVAKPISLLFAETSMSMAILLLAQAITDIILLVFFAFGDRPNTSMSKLSFYALYFIHYLAICIIYVVIIFIMYPRYDPNTGQPLPHQLPPGVSDSWLRSEGSRGDFRRYSVPATMMHRAPDESFAANYLPTNWQTMQGRMVNTERVARTRSRALNDMRNVQTFNHFPISPEVEMSPSPRSPRHRSQLEPTHDNPFALVRDVSPNRLTYPSHERKRARNPKYWSVPHKFEDIEGESNRTSQFTESTERGTRTSTNPLVSPTQTQSVSVGSSRRFDQQSALGLEIQKPMTAVSAPIRKSRGSIVDDSSIAILSSYGYPITPSKSHELKSSNTLHSTVPIRTRPQSSTQFELPKELKMEQSNPRLSLGVISDGDNSSLNSSQSHIRSNYPEFHPDLPLPSASELTNNFSEHSPHDPYNSPSRNSSNGSQTFSSPFLKRPIQASFIKE